MNGKTYEQLAGSGGLVASVEDLAKFLAAQMDPGVLSSEMLEQLHEKTALADGLRIGTALGWSVKHNVYVGRILEKNGGRSNCSAWIGFAPEHKVGVVVVTNCGGPDVDSIGTWLLERSVPGAHQPVNKTGYARVAPYFRQPTTEQHKPQRPVTEDELYEPLKAVGFDDATVRHLLGTHSRGLVQRWVTRQLEDDKQSD